MLTIGICGSSGSGKTMLAVARLPGRITLVHQDAYYRDHSHLSFEDRARINYDHPDVFDHDLIYEDLKALTEGRLILEKPRVTGAPDIPTSMRRSTKIHGHTVYHGQHG